MKMFIKKYLYKVLSVVCVLAICLVTAYYNLPVFASDSGTGGSYPISTWQAIEKLSEVSGLARFECIQIFDWSEYEETYFVTANAKNTEMHENQFDFWFDENHTMQYTHWLNGEISYSSVEDSYRRGGGGGRVRGGTVPASDFKVAVEDYNSRYAPMPTVSQYIYSVRNSDLTVKNYNDRYYYYTPYTPVYRYTSGAWGGKNWGSVYLLPFVYDDNECKGYYYHKYFYHFYSSKDENGVVWVHSECYMLSDGSLVKANKLEWDITKYPVLGFKHFPSSWCLYCYSSDFNYISNNYESDLRSELFSYTDYTFYNILNSKVSFSCSDLVSLDTGTLDLENNNADDIGAILSATPFELFANQTAIDFTKIPDNYNITIQGDTIYNYPISDPDTGKSTTINNYITNNYIIPDNPDPVNPDDPDNPGGGSVSGDITVGGTVTVGGQIEFKADPIDINLNVSGGSSGSETSDVVSPDISDTVNYLPENTETMKNYFSVFFDFLPPEMLALLLGGIACAILCRALGR